MAASNANISNNGAAWQNGTWAPTAPVWPETILYGYPPNYMLNGNNGAVISGNHGVQVSSGATYWSSSTNRKGKARKIKTTAEIEADAKPFTFDTLFKMLRDGEGANILTRVVGSISLYQVMLFSKSGQRIIFEVTAVEPAKAFKKLVIKHLKVLRASRMSAVDAPAAP